MQDLRRGQWIFYRINPDLSVWVKELVSQTLAANYRYIDDEMVRLAAMGERPDRAKLCC